MFVSTYECLDRLTAITLSCIIQSNAHFPFSYWVKDNKPSQFSNRQCIVLTQCGGLRSADYGTVTDCVTPPTTYQWNKMWEMEFIIKQLYWQWDRTINWVVSGFSQCYTDIDFMPHCAISQSEGACNVSHRVVLCNIRNSARCNGLPSRLTVPNMSTNHHSVVLV